MKKTVTFLFATGFALLTSAQTTRVMPDLDTWKKESSKCGTMENMERLEKLHPELRKQMADYEQQIQAYIASHANEKSSQAVVTIPVVVHVVWNTTAENISNAAVNGLITILNEDYSRTNADASQTPAAWQSIASATDVQFCLAQRDPAGNPSTGIVRVQTTQTSFTSDDKVKFNSQGGSDAWPTTQYFNIWICDLAGGLGGYGEFPSGTPTNTFGNVTDYTLVGGYVATHECGHCFNLFHIWGDDGGACTGSDAVSDTPNQADATNANCGTYPMTDACQTAAPGIMFMNYMDYTWGCTNLFTQGQAARVNAVVNTPPYNALGSSLGCTPVNLLPNDAAISNVVTPNGLVCTITFTPVVTVKNWGNNNLTSCIISYQIDAGPVQTYTWTGSLVSLATTTVALSAVTTTAGTHTLTSSTSNPNSTTDGNPGNDQNVSVFNSGSALLPLVEGFQASTSMPPGWSIVDMSNDGFKWIVSNVTGGFGASSQCMAFDNCAPSTDITGTKDRFVTAQYDFSGATSAQMTFDVASTYLIYQGTTYADTLVVFYSTNCGSTWNQVYVKGGAVLATAPNFTVVAPNCFVPTASQWRTETINLNAVAGQSGVMFAFENRSQWAEWMYIDNINISSNVGISTIDLSSSVDIYPNPSNGEIFVHVNASKLGSVSIKVLNTLGEEVAAISEQVDSPKKIKLDLKGKCNAGVYFVEISSSFGSSIKKIALVE